MLELDTLERRARAGPRDYGHQAEAAMLGHSPPFRLRFWLEILEILESQSFWNF